MLTPSAPIFRPSEPVIDEVLALCADPGLTLSDIALRHSTTIEALTLFIARTDIAERLESLHAAAASRARFIAANLIPMALDALTRVLRDSEAEDKADAAAPPENKRTPELRQRARETTRRAASRILSLTTFNPPRLFTVARAYQPVSSAHGVPRAARLPVPSADAQHESPATPPVLNAPGATGSSPARAGALGTHDSPPVPPVHPAQHSSLPAPDSIPFPTSLPNLIPGRFSGLPNLPASPPTKHRAPHPQPRSPANLLKLAGASPHEHWP